MRFYNAIPDKNIVTDKIIKWIADIATVMVLALFCITFFCGHTKVVGNSMNDTLHNDNVVMIDSLCYRISEPERYDVILFEKVEKNNEEVEYIKRIVGLPGETVQIKDGKIYINNKELENKNLDENIVNAGLAKEKIELEYNEYFVIGDNANNSEDSRFSTVGNVKLDEIKGKVWLVAWPFASIKTVN